MAAAARPGCVAALFLRPFFFFFGIFVRLLPHSIEGADTWSFFRVARAPHTGHSLSLPDQVLCAARGSANRQMLGIALLKAEPRLILDKAARRCR